MKKNGSPTVSEWNALPPLGRQKLTPEISGLAVITSLTEVLLWMSDHAPDWWPD